MKKKAKTAEEPANHIAVFQEATIRRVWHNEAWWFSLVDVCAILTASPDAGAYWRKLKQRLNAEGGQPVTFCHGLKLKAPDGKQRETDCANTEGLFRLIQSIPSPKAEPFKRWLAQVGYERVKEIENPELASARARELPQPNRRSPKPVFARSHPRAANRENLAVQPHQILRLPRFFTHHVGVGGQELAVHHAQLKRGGNDQSKCPKGSALLAFTSPREKLVCRSFTLGRLISTSRANWLKLLRSWLTTCSSKVPVPLM